LMSGRHCVYGRDREVERPADHPDLRNDIPRFCLAEPRAGRDAADFAISHRGGKRCCSVRDVCWTSGNPTSTVSRRAGLKLLRRPRGLIAIMQSGRRSIVSRPSLEHLRPALIRGRRERPAVLRTQRRAHRRARELFTLPRPIVAREMRSGIGLEVLTEI